MQWIKVYTGLRTHPKAVRLGKAALGLWLDVALWCGEQETEFLPDEMLPTFTGKRERVGLIARLVDAGLWERVDGGYRIHDFFAWQGSGTIGGSRTHAGAHTLAAGSAHTPPATSARTRAYASASLAGTPPAGSAPPARFAPAHTHSRVPAVSPGSAPGSARPRESAPVEAAPAAGSARPRVSRAPEQAVKHLSNSEGAVVVPPDACASAGAPAHAGDEATVSGVGRLSGVELEQNLALVRRTADAAARRHRQPVALAGEQHSPAAADALHATRRRLERLRAEGKDPLADLEA